MNVAEQPLLRLVVMGKKSLPDPAKHGRPYWGCVELVTTKLQDIKDALKEGAPCCSLMSQGKAVCRCRMEGKKSELLSFTLLDRFLQRSTARRRGASAGGRRRGRSARACTAS